MYGIHPGKIRVYGTLAALTAAPLVLWATALPFAQRWTDVSTVVRSIGQMTGIAGMALFSCAILMSARFRWLERVLGPLDQVYAAHHAAGGLAFGLLLLHPMSLYAAYALGEPDRLAGLLVPGIEAAVTWGMLSLWSLIILLVLTFYARPRYGVWKKVHRFMGAAFFFAGIHGATVSSDIAWSLPLRAYLLGLAAAAGCSFVAYSLLNRRTVRRYSYAVREIERLSPSVVRLVLAPKAGPLTAAPGAFVFLTLRPKGRPTEPHPFSIAAPPSQDGAFEVHVKALGDDTRRIVQETGVGDDAEVEGPFGRFGVDIDKRRPVLCIAGGIGVTPFLGWLRTAPDGRRTDVFYSVRTRGDAVHLPALRDIEKANPDVRVTEWFSDETGVPTAEAILSATGSPPDRQMLMCGPPPMLKALEGQFLRLGARREDIRYELFDLGGSI